CHAAARPRRHARFGTVPRKQREGLHHPLADDPRLVAASCAAPMSLNELQTGLEPEPLMFQPAGESGIAYNRVIDLHEKGSRKLLSARLHCTLRSRGNAMIELAPSILSADFARLGAHAQSAIDGGGTLLHVDIMDGHFVPNLTIGPPVVVSLRKAVPDVPFDCHLMIENPDEFIAAFAEI